PSTMGSPATMGSAEYADDRAGRAYRQWLAETVSDHVPSGVTHALAVLTDGGRRRESARRCRSAGGPAPDRAASCTSRGRRWWTPLVGHPPSAPRPRLRPAASRRRLATR